MSSEFPRRLAAIVVAAGRGERAGAEGGPKQYRPLGGSTIMAHTLEALLANSRISTVLAVIHRDDEALFRQATGTLAERAQLTIGGATRQDSVRLGLNSLRGSGVDAVLIHDAVRPFISTALLDRIIGALTPESGACPALPLVETIKRGGDGRIVETIDRQGLYGAQTPQAFPFEPILRTHEKAAKHPEISFTDDASIAEWAGLPVNLVDGDPENIKLTFARDIDMANERLTGTTIPFPDVRTGDGYDVHSFEPGDGVTLAGVKIPHSRKLNGHSDADVALHALTDALLATCGAGDIGTHFPPSDMQWRGAASRIFVEHAVRLIRARGGRIANADVTLICEAPKIGPHRAAMTQVLSEMLGVSLDRVSVKATTNEKLGFVGREEGIAAIATATVVFPGSLPE